MNPTDTGSPRRFNLVKWVKKNKLVAALLAGLGVLFIAKKGADGGEGGSTITDEEGEASGASVVQLVPVTSPPTEEYEKEYPESEQPYQEPPEVIVPEPAPVAEPPETPEAPVGAAPPESKVVLHGKTFNGATGSTIRDKGTVAGKQFVEYVITYPGRQEVWRYFTATGNWRKASNTKEGAAGNKGGSGKPPRPNPNPQPNPQPKPKPKPKPNPPPSIAPAKPVAAPAGCQAQHPNAVHMGIGSGHPKPKAPAGWHVFQCGGAWWRAPN